MKHYVITLEKQRYRFDVWKGYQLAKHFDFDALTICHAIDASRYKNIFELAELALSWDIDWQRVIDENDPRTDQLGYISLRLGIDRILSRISESPGGWHAIWLDDEVLTVGYQRFLMNFAAFSEYPEIEVVACNKGQWHNENFPESNAVGKERWEKRFDRMIRTHTAFKGCVGSSFDRCLVVTPGGARRLLAFGLEHSAESYEWLAFHKLGEREGFYTAIETCTTDIGWFLGSDIENTKAHSSERVWDLSQ